MGTDNDADESLPNTPPEQTLCAQCRGLNLSGLFESRYREERRYSHEKEYRIPIKPTTARPDSVDCALCDILFTRHSYRAVVYDTQLELGASRFPYDRGTRIKNERQYLAPFICSWSRELGQSVGYFFEDGEPALVHTPEKNFSLNHPKGFSPQQIPDWISDCKHRHQDTCSYSKQVITGQHLIDCHKLTIVSAGEFEYIALSYVWGSSGDGKTTDRLRRSEDNEVLLLPENLPLVVVDAITVTKDLGFKYLWVDKYCIDQHDAEVKQKQIEQMDAVYANSELTIIAAAGEDDNYGLPGVSSRPHTVAPMVEIGETKILRLQNPQVSIRNSKWSTRGWTYQEGFLSRRQLYFLDGHTYFECGARGHCWIIPDVHREFSPMKRKFDYSNGIEAVLLYNRIVSDYTARELGHDSDSIFALVGILRHLNIRHVWGILESVPGSRIPEKLTFAMGLYWYDEVLCGYRPRALRRRAMFPSWTWAGWAGRVTCLYFGGRGFLELGDIWLEDPDDRNRRSEISAVAELSLSENLRHRVLVVEAWPVSPDDIDTEIRPYDQNDWFIHDHIALFHSLESFEGAGSNTELANNLKRKGDQWHCVSLFNIKWEENWDKDQFLLILRREMNEDLWERVGTVTISSRSRSLRGI